MIAFETCVALRFARPTIQFAISLLDTEDREDRKHNVPFRQIVKIRMALFQTFGWRAGSSWVVVQADTYKLTSCFLSR